jgi:hypothetical protein
MYCPSIDAGINSPEKFVNIFARLHRALTMNLLPVPGFIPFVYNVGQKLWAIFWNTHNYSQDY